MNSDRKTTTRVAVVGGGPCATTLATLLADKGIDVVMFTDGKRPGLVVGESLIPALIPIFRRLGIEDEVAGISQHKPGATFRFGLEEQIELSFEAVRGILPTYSYNVPRPAFDEILEARAARSGARCVKARAKLCRAEPAAGGPEITLDEETLALVPEWEGRHPDLIVDATGRARAVARLLEIPARIGPRKDVAYFAHYENFEPEGPPGQTIIGRLPESGWSWRIPLCDRLSVGIVLNMETAKKLGDTPAERLEAAIDQAPDLSAKGKNRRRLTDVPTYTNYQLISERGYGPGWVSAGDAYGFVDPMLSPGLFLAMWSAEHLAKIIPLDPASSTKRSFKRYGARMHHMIESWQHLVTTFYDGTIFSVQRAGTEISEDHPGWISDRIERHIEKHLAGMACGAFTDRPYSQYLVRKLTRHGLRGHDPQELAIQ